MAILFGADSLPSLLALSKKSVLWSVSDGSDMSRLFHPLLYLLASVTKQELARQLHFLKVENEILRSRLGPRIRVTTPERKRLLNAGRGLGAQIHKLVTIVQPATFLRWIRQERSLKGRPAKVTKKGRMRTPEEVRELVLRMARENHWGCARIIGELRKLGMRKICRQTIRNILKDGGIEPGPKVGQGTWDQFLKIHAQSLWACDFLSVKSFTRRGIVDLYLLAFIHVDSRRVWVSSCTSQPDSAWVTEQAKTFRSFVRKQKLQANILLRDRDSKYSANFDQVINRMGCRPMRLPVMSPNLNGRCERFIWTLKHECLNHFLVLGERHLNYLVEEFQKHYLVERPHQGIGNRTVLNSTEPEHAVPLNQVACTERLGGLLKHYHRRAA